MSRGDRALRLAVLVLALNVVATGCAATALGGWGKVAPAPAYVPLTTSTFATGMTTAMFRYDTVHVDFEVLDESMSMDVDYGDEDDPAMAGTFDDGKSVGTMVLVDGEVFFRDDGDPVYYQFPDQLADQVFADSAMSNPAEMARNLQSGIASVEYGGANEVAYGPAHRYDVTMRKEFLAEELDLPVGSVPDFTYRMWLDDHHLLRRFIVTVAGRTASDVTFTAWGDPTDISAPPASQVEPLPLPSDEA